MYLSSSFSPMITPYITTVNGQNQEIGLAKGIGMLVCYAMLSHLYICVATTLSKYRTIPSPQRTLSCYIFYIHPWTLATTNLFSISIIVSFWQCYINGITQCMTFDTGFFHSRPLRSIPIFACVNNLFLFNIDWYSMVCIFHSLFNQLPIKGYFCCLEIWL